MSTVTFFLGIGAAGLIAAVVDRIICYRARRRGEWRQPGYFHICKNCDNGRNE